MQNVWTIIQIIIAVIKAAPTIWAIIKEILEMIENEKDPVKKFEMKTDFRKALIDTKQQRKPKPIADLVECWKELV